jgi:SAM-dependent methyltransferase
MKASRSFEGSRVSTVEYYNRNAERFFQETVKVNMEELYGPFLSLLPIGGSILDAGCGSGRDSLYFSRKGFKVTAFDASEQLVERSAKLTGLPIQLLTFQQLDFDNHFDGIWACASLLHVPRIEIGDVLRRLARALKSNGVLYASFKQGDGEWEKDGRFFNSYDEDSFGAVAGEQPNLSIVRQWVSDDVRRGVDTQSWFNVFLRKE